MVEVEHDSCSEEPRHFLASLSVIKVRHLVTLPKDSVIHQFFDHFWGSEHPAIIAGYVDVQGAWVLTQSHSYENPSNFKEVRCAMASKDEVPMEPQQLVILKFGYRVWSHSKIMDKKNTDCQELIQFSIYL